MSLILVCVADLVHDSPLMKNNNWNAVIVETITNPSNIRNISQTCSKLIVITWGPCSWSNVSVDVKCYMLSV